MSFDRYAVIGNPVEHSKSPLIHAAFASQTGQQLRYDRILAPIDGVRAAVNTFYKGGGKGLNVTVPFKEQAFQLATRLSRRAQLAGAVNTLRFDDSTIFGDNTDGAGLCTDIRDNLGVPLQGKRILLLGAGGAARGVLQPLLAEQPASLTIANRTDSKAGQLAEQFASLGPITGGGYAALAGQSFDIVINATSASLANEQPPLPAGCFASGSLAYDMMYGKGQTPFLLFAEQQGAARQTDGLGMLVEQAAESFLLWRGIKPRTLPLIAQIRAGLL